MEKVAKASFYESFLLNPCIKMICGSNNVIAGWNKVLLLLGNVLRREQKVSVINKIKDGQNVKGTCIK